MQTTYYRKDYTGELVEQTTIATRTGDDLHLTDLADKDSKGTLRHTLCGVRTHRGLYSEGQAATCERCITSRKAVTA